MRGPALPSPSIPRYGPGACLCIVAVAGAIAMLGAPASAQVVIGGQTPPNVIVDYSVLDELSPPPSVPQVLMDRPAGRPAKPYSYSTGPRWPQLPGSGRWENPGPIVLKPPPTATEPTARTPRPAARPKSVAPPQRSVKPKPPSRPATIARPAAPPPQRATTMDRPAPAPKKKPATVRTSAVPPEPLLPPAPPELAPMPAEIAPPPAQPAALVKASQPPPAQPNTMIETPVSPPAPPKPAVQREAAPAPRLAALRDTAPIRPGSLRRIAFTPGSAKLSPSAAEELRSVAEAMGRDEALRIQLLAYAGEKDDSSSQARRLSLSRALAARSQLIEQGVRSTRIDVRALGNKSAGGPADRIDIIVTRR